MLRWFGRYLYCEQLELSEDNVFSVLYAAKKYLVRSLCRRCVAFLESVLSPLNVCAFLENVFLFEDEYPALRQRCFQVSRRRSLSMLIGSCSAPRMTHIHCSSRVQHLT